MWKFSPNRRFWNSLLLIDSVPCKPMYFECLHFFQTVSRVLLSEVELKKKHTTGKFLFYLGRRPHYVGEIWKRSFISTVRPTVHTNPSRKRNFSQTLFTPEEFENAGFVF